MERLTPELALVDPRCAVLARASLPDPPDCLFRQWASEPRGDLTGPSGPARTSKTGRASGRARHVFSWGIVVVFVGSSLLAFIPPRQSARPELVRRAPAVHAGSSQESTQRIHWAAVRNAVAYDLILVTGTGKVERWTKGTSHRLRVQRRDRGPASQWYVYPVYSAGSTYRYGPLAGQGSIPRGDVSFLPVR